MSSINLTTPAGSIVVPVGRQSRVVLFGPAPNVAAGPLVVHGQIYGVGVGGSEGASAAGSHSVGSGANGWRDVLRQLDTSNTPRLTYSGVAPGATDNPGLPQITGAAIATGNLTVTRTGGSDVVPVSGSWLFVKNSPTDGANSADRFVSLTGATAASWTA